jgi:hypothetical protein
MKFAYAAAVTALLVGTQVAAQNIELLKSQLPKLPSVFDQTGQSAAPVSAMIEVKGTLVIYEQNGCRKSPVAN